MGITLKPHTDEHVFLDTFALQVYILVRTVNKFSLTSFVARVHGMPILIF